MRKRERKRGIKKDRRIPSGERLLHTDMMERQIKERGRLLRVMVN